MPCEILKEPWLHIEAILEQGGAEELGAYLDSLSPSDVARAISRLDDDGRASVLTMLGPEDAADLIEELTDAQGADILEDLPAIRAAAIVDAMESDERADVLAELDDEDAEAILAQMDPEEAADARKLLTYPADTAGGIMVTEFLAFTMHHRVADVLKDLRENAEEYQDLGVQYVYVVNERNTLVGVIRLRDIVLSPSDAPLTSVMIPNPLYLLVDTPLDEAEDMFDKYTFHWIPVCDEQGHLVGVVTRSGVEEAWGERADKALAQFSGIVGGDELRSMSLLERSFRRMSWLSVNLVLSVVAASVILHFEGAIKQLTALAFFIPIIGNMSGCSGNQAVGVSIRELALGIVRPEDGWRVFVKEAQVGVLNGLLLGLLVTIVGSLVGAFTDEVGIVGGAYIGLVAGGALALNTIVALSLGGLIPLVLRRLDVDPALSAPPIVTTVSDLCGFLIFLSLATWFLVS